MNRAATQDLRVVRVWPTMRGRPRRVHIRRRLERGEAVALVDEWLAAGGSRLDRDLDGKIDAAGCGGARRGLAAARRCGARRRARVRSPPTLATLVPRDDAPNAGGSAYLDGWYSYLDKDLRVAARPSRAATVRGRVLRTWRAGRVRVVAVGARSGRRLRQLEQTQGGRPSRLARRCDEGTDHVRAGDPARGRCAGRIGPPSSRRSPSPRTARPAAK